MNLTQLEAQLHAEMVNIYNTARKELNDSPSYFLKMLNNDGPLETARKLASDPKKQTGFIKLCTANRPDLTAEALVLDPRFSSLFDEETKRIAIKKLRETDVNLSQIPYFNEKDALDDIEEAKDDLPSDKTERKAILKSRIGQGKFREELIDIWKSCSVTGLSEIPILRASHIKPWHNSDNKERLDKYNGLLLSPNLDVLFDKGYISFDNEMRRDFCTGA